MFQHHINDNNFLILNNGFLIIFFVLQHFLQTDNKDTALDVEVELLYLTSRDVSY